MSRGHICLIGNVAEDMQAYRQALLAAQATVSCHATLSEFLAAGDSQAVSGIVIDLRALFAMDLQERAILADVEARIPLMRARRNATTGEMAGMVGGKALEGDAMFEFVNLCAAAEPRFVRGGLRRSLHVDVAVVFQSAMAESRGYLTSTLNVSETGLFVILPVVSPPPLNARALVELASAPNLARLQAEVRWAIPWGATKGKLPGIGVRLIELTEPQQRYLRALVNA